jgi:hypothetical protein
MSELQREELDAKLSGKNMSAAQAEVQRQLEATAVLLDKVQKQIDQAPAPAPKK